MRKHLRNQKGFTLVEVTIILLVLTILASIMLPQLGNFNRLARFVKTREDVGALCSVIKKMLDEVKDGAIFKDPRHPDPMVQRTPIGLLYGPGEIPQEGTALSGRSTGLPGSHNCSWTRVAGDVCQESTDDFGVSAETQDYQVALLQNILDRNDPDGDGASVAPDNFPNPLDDPDEHAHGTTGAGAYFGWRGNYLDWLSYDPWGNRYMVNSFALHAPFNSMATNATIHTSAVVCYSAGADERIDTYFNQPANQKAAGNDPGIGWQNGKDDISAILSAGGPF